ncbi:MAG: HEAT repeat domain-containing protein [Acidobacteria bacterium]|nr:HEAT repeat domain-containing protein [Acidobacteriota bacterium]MBV9148168.1 HEAT repeat domain-containing protein [Acidobacteriota bacterium]
MNCEWTRANAALYVYDELKDDERYELERHVERCSGCRTELDAVRGFRLTMSGHPLPEPSPNLLASSRMRLSEALESEEPNRGWHRFTFDFAGWLQSMRFAPALTAALLLIGFAGGVLTTYQVAVQRQVAETAKNVPVPAVDSASITGIRGITQQPGSNKVDIQYDKVFTDHVEGSIDDPKIQQLLLFAARNNINSGVQLDSIDLLTKSPDDSRVREALIFALHYDRNPGVRLKALDGLRGYVKDDAKVRDAVLEALLQDSNPGVRTQAISLLESVKNDSSVRQALTALAQQDKDKYIQEESRRVLANLPDFE